MNKYLMYVGLLWMILPFIIRGFLGFWGDIFSPPVEIASFIVGLIVLVLAYLFRRKTAR